MRQGKIVKRWTKKVKKLLLIGIVIGKVEMFRHGIWVAWTIFWRSTLQTWQMREQAFVFSFRYAAVQWIYFGWQRKGIGLSAWKFAGMPLRSFLTKICWSTCVLRPACQQNLPPLTFLRPEKRVLQYFSSISLLSQMRLPKDNSMRSGTDSHLWRTKKDESGSDILTQFFQC